MPDVVWDYLKQKQKERTERVGQTPVKEYKRVVEELKEEIPCGGTCAIPKRETERQGTAMKEELLKVHSTSAWRNMGEEQSETILPTIVTPSEIGREIESKKEPSSWFEAQAQKMQEWSAKIAEKKTAKVERLASALPWDTLKQGLPWDKEEASMQKYIAEKAEVKADLQEQEKRINLLQMKELPWQKVRERVKEGLPSAVAHTNEVLLRDMQIRETEAHAKGKEIDLSELSTEQSESIDELLTSIANEYNEKYEPMRGAIQKIRFSGPFAAEAKKYLGEQFQDEFEADYDTLTKEEEKKARDFAEKLWQKHKGEEDRQGAWDELIEMRDNLAIDGVEYNAIDDRLNELGQEEARKEREAKIQKIRETARKFESKYRGTRMDADELATQLIDEFKEESEASDVLDNLNLPDEKNKQVARLLGKKEQERISRIWNEVDEAAAAGDEGYKGLIARLERNTELSDDQRESLETDLQEEINQVIFQEQQKLPPSVKDATLEYKTEFIKKAAKAEDIDEVVVAEMIEEWESEDEDEKYDLKEANLLGFSPTEQLAILEDMKGIPGDKREHLEGIIHERWGREKTTAELLEKDKRKAMFEEEAKKRGGGIHAKTSKGYTLHFTPRAPGEKFEEKETRQTHFKVHKEK
jgi:hypothetical protein